MSHGKLVETLQQGLYDTASLLLSLFRSLSESLNQVPPVPGFFLRSPTLKYGLYLFDCFLSWYWSCVRLTATPLGMPSPVSYCDTSAHHGRLLAVLFDRRFGIHFRQAGRQASVCAGPIQPARVSGGQKQNRRATVDSQRLISENFIKLSEQDRKRLLWLLLAALWIYLGRKVQ